MSISVLDLFCGAGGSSYGARNAGATIACGIDACPLAIQTYKLNFPNTVALNATLDERSGATLLGEIRNVDLILASPECTNHTCAKGGRPRDEQSRLSARYVLRFARQLRPRWIVLENVIQMRWWQGYHPLIEEIQELGYHVQPQVLDAADFGVPQTRRRLFVICDREIVPEPLRVPATTWRTASEILDPPGTWDSRPLTAKTGPCQPWNELIGQPGFLGGVCHFWSYTMDPTVEEAGTASIGHCGLLQHWTDLASSLGSATRRCSGSSKCRN